MSNTVSFQSMLIVWVYFPAVGHFIEAIEVAAAYKAKNPNLKITLLLNTKTVFYISKFCPWITNYFAIDITEIKRDKEYADCIKKLQQKWDYIIYPKRLKYTPQDFTKELLSVNQFFQSYFNSNIDQSYHYEKFNDNSPEYKPHPEFRLVLPEETLDWASRKIKGNTSFVIMFSGASAEKIYPTLSQWKKLLIHLKKKYPSATIFLTGRYPNLSNAEKKKYISQINKITENISSCFNMYDLSLEKQLALIQISNLFISPHSGFSFFAPCVGTPWLCISGAYWKEPLISNMPFYSVLPKCKKYPCHGKTKNVCKYLLRFKRQVPCMWMHANEKMKEIDEAVNLLLQEKLSFKDSINLYNQQVKNKGLNINRHLLS